jgi:hypothetical protein
MRTRPSSCPPGQGRAPLGVIQKTDDRIAELLIGFTQQHVLPIDDSQAIDRQGRRNQSLPCRERLNDLHPHPTSEAQWSHHNGCVVEIGCQIRDVAGHNDAGASGLAELGWGTIPHDVQNSLRALLLHERKNVLCQP